MKNLLHIFVLGAVFLASIAKMATVYPTPVNQKHFETIYPVKAVEYLREEGYSGRLFNSYNWGGYLLWSLPEFPVFVDGRTDLFSDEIIGDWLEVAQYRQNWAMVLEKWNINIVLMESSWLPAKLMTAHGWCNVYEDEIAVILLKCQ